MLLATTTGEICIMRNDGGVQQIKVPQNGYITSNICTDSLFTCFRRMLSRSRTTIRYCVLKASRKHFDSAIKHYILCLNLVDQKSGSRSPPPSRINRAGNYAIRYRELKA